LPECKACPVGYYQSEIRQSSCTRCMNCTLGSRQKCSKSFEGFCAACAPGQYTNTTSESCIECPRGYHQKTSGQNECDECKQNNGDYQRLPGKSYCDEVPSGSSLVMVASKEDSTELVAEPLKCPAGKYSASNANGCAPCKPGTVQPEEGKSVCQSCASSQYIQLQSNNQPNNKTCLDCPAVGVTCNGIRKIYSGSVWHDPTVKNPQPNTTLYTCVTK
jgi:hypothetical protein